jgi:hypothetical protein
MRGGGGARKILLASRTSLHAIFLSLKVKESRQTHMHEAVARWSEQQLSEFFENGIRNMVRHLSDACGDIFLNLAVTSPVSIIERVSIVCPVVVERNKIDRRTLL